MAAVLASQAEYSLLEDSRYTSQQISEGSTVPPKKWPGISAFTRVLRRAMPGHDVESVCLRVRRQDCWIADTSQWPPRTRMKVHTSVASSGPPCSTRPLSRSIVSSLSEKRIATVA
jgi:hypothetical protein